MKNATSIGRIAALLVAMSALAALTGVAQAAGSRPEGMSTAEHRALHLRSEALNQKYGLSSVNRALRLRSQALNEKYGLGRPQPVVEGMTPAAYGALMLRSEALNEKYGLDKQTAAALTSEPTSSTRGFAWEAFGFGAAAMFGLALAAGGFFVRSQLVAAIRGLTPRYRTT